MQSTWSLTSSWAMREGELSQSLGPIWTRTGALLLPGLIALLGSQAAGWSATANAAAQSFHPLSPIQAAAETTLPPGFQVTLFAGEPHVGQPVALAFDDRGRLWVAEFNTYADLQTNFDLQQQDRIVIFEDADFDGRFDRRTVFWDQGQRLTSIAIGFGGVWALCAPHLLFIPDRNGDDVPDGPPEVLLDGWDAGPVRHNIVNGLKWGPDGWLYGRHGIQATSNVGTPGTPPSERTRLNCAIWRYHPTRRVFEVFCQGGTNPWGHDWNEEGELFFINTVIGHLWHGIPGAFFQRMYGEHLAPRRYQLIDQHADHYHWDTGKSWTDSRQAGAGADALGGGHAHSGLMIYLGNNWPASYQHRLFTLNFHGRRINQERLEPHGSGYVARHEPDLLKFQDPWFRGIDLGCGPNGAVYLLDWSDTGECHENDEDGVHRETGRIFHVAFGSPPPPAIANVASLSNHQLLALLTQPNEWYVRQARLELQERAAAGHDLAEVHAALRALFERASEVSHQLRALWVLHATQGADEPWLRSCLEHPQPAVRSWAARLLVDSTYPGPATLDQFEKRARQDPSPRVRLALASALQRLPLASRRPLALALLAHGEDAQDHNLPLMIWYGIEPCLSARPDQAAPFYDQNRLPSVRQCVARFLAENLNQQSDPVDRLLLWATRQHDEQIRLDVLRGLDLGLRGLRQVPPPPAWTAFQEHAAHSPLPEVRELLRGLGVLFGDGLARAELEQMARDASLDGETRRTALRQLIASPSPDLLNLLASLLNDPATSGVALRGLANFDDPKVPKLALGHFQQMEPAEQTAVVGLLAARPAYAHILLEAVAQDRIPRRLVTSFHARQIQGHQDQDLNRLLTAAWGEIRSHDADKQALLTRYRALLTPQRLSQANLNQGRLLYQQTCAPCHRLHGQGGPIGPDLTGSGRHDLGYLLENIVDPSAMVPEDYRVAHLELADDRLLSGIILRQNDQTVTLQTPDDQLILPRSEVLAIQPSSLSLMPEGLLDGYQEAQIIDLIGYLQE